MVFNNCIHNWIFILYYWMMYYFLSRIFIN